MTHCRVEQDLNKFLAEEETTFHRMEAIEYREKEVRETFCDIANGPEGFDHACYWLGGEFSEELMDNALSVLFGDTNPYFEEAVTRKAAEMVDADKPEPDAPDYDDDRL